MPLSQRTRWNFSPNAITTVTSAVRASGAPLWDLTATNPTRAELPLGPFHTNVLAAIATPDALVYHPDPRGLSTAREAVAGYYRTRGFTVDPGQVILSASTSEAYGWLFKTLCDPGDEVLVAHPSYPLFDDLARMEGVQLRPFPLVYDGAWRMDLDALRAAMRPNTKAVAVVHPNNPTGSYVTLDEQRALGDLCATHGLALIADEVFGDYAFGEDPHRAPSFVTVDTALTFTLSGLSKVAALPQMKLGWIAASGPPRAVSEALERLEMVADCYLSVAAPVQHAAGYLLGAASSVESVVRARVQANLAALRARLLPDSRVSLLRVEGGWTAVLRVPRTRTEEDWCVTLAERDGVLVGPGYFYDFVAEAYLVVSLLPPEDVFAEGIARVVDRIDGDDFC